VDDGSLIFEVESVKEHEIHTIIMYNGVLGEYKGLVVPGLKPEIPTISEVDLDDINFCCENDIDIIALSHIRTAQDVIDVRNLPNVKEKKYENSSENRNSR